MTSHVSRASWALLAVCSVAASAPAFADPQPLTVKCVRKIERFEPLYKNDAAGRLAYLSTAACNYRETVGKGLFNDVRSAATGFTDLNLGRGETRGITAGSKGGDDYRVEWLGRCYSTGRANNADLIRCTGVWSFIDGSGTGRFANLRGGGHWHMQMTADGGLDTEASGLYEQ